MLDWDLAPIAKSIAKRIGQDAQFVGLPKTFVDYSGD